MRRPYTFLRTWIVSLAGLALLVAAVNLGVDPYAVFGTPRIAGLSKYKPVTKNHTLLAKIFQVARFRPNTVVIGSSPVHIGIDAGAPVWPQAMGRVYNFGIPGIYETSTGLRTLQEAVAAGGIRNAVVFLDFQNFLSPENPDPALVEAERRFRFLPDGKPNPDSLTARATDRFLSVATLGALVDSLTTVAMQRRHNVLNLAPNGSGSEADFIDAARSDGMHELFAQKDAYEAERVQKLVPIMAAWHGPLPDIDSVAAIVAFARAHDVKLTLAIAPHHADALELYWRAGLWPRVEQLKTELTDLVAAQGGAVTLWDFLDYSSFNTEPVPSAGDRRTPTSWFWEPTHFKKQLGEVMIQRMFGDDAPAFGVMLTRYNVAAHNADIRTYRHNLICEPGIHAPAALAPRPDDHCDRTQTPYRPT